MSKKLPKPKKSLKSFISEEDAKIVDKTSAKISIIASFLSFNFLAGVDETNAFGHGSHDNHVNNIAHPDDIDIREGFSVSSSTDDDGFTTDIYNVENKIIHKNPDLFNTENEDKDISLNVISDGNSGIGFGGPKYDEEHTITATKKTSTVAHGNHYNHSSGGGSS